MLALKCHNNLLQPAQVSCAEVTFKVNLCADENNQADMKGKHWTSYFLPGAVMYPAEFCFLCNKSLWFHPQCALGREEEGLVIFVTDSPVETKPAVIQHLKKLTKIAVMSPEPNVHSSYENLDP